MVLEKWVAQTTPLATLQAGSAETKPRFQNKDDPDTKVAFFKDLMAVSGQRSDSFLMKAYANRAGNGINCLARSWHEVPSLDFTILLASARTEGLSETNSAGLWRRFFAFHSQMYYFALSLEQ